MTVLSRRAIALTFAPLFVLYGTAFSDAPEDPDRGFTALFNGHDLMGWEGDTTGYVVEGGEIVCKAGHNLYTAEAFDDFILRFEFKLTAGANNGLGIRMAPGAHAAYEAIELQIPDDTAAKHKDLHPYQYHGSIYGVVPAKRGHLKRVGEWNEQEVIANGHRIKVTLNGTVIVDADIEEASKGGTMDEKDHAGLLRPSGRIGFLGHGDLLYFRNIRIKRIED